MASRQQRRIAVARSSSQSDTCFSGVGARRHALEEAAARATQRSASGCDLRPRAVRDAFVEDSQRAPDWAQDPDEQRPAATADVGDRAEGREVVRVRNRGRRLRREGRHRPVEQPARAGSFAISVNGSASDRSGGTPAVPAHAVPASFQLS
jgi:hypothetical protein